MDDIDVGAPSTRRRKGIALAGIAAAIVVMLGAAQPKVQEAAPGALGAPSVPEGPPYRVGGEVTPPAKFSGAAPVYTEMARKARVTGVVIVELVIDKGGNVTSSRILKGLPMGLDGAALDAVKTWKFTPGQLRGDPVPVYFVVTVNFQLDSDFDFGPAYSAFLGDHGDVRALAEERKYGEAGALLDGFLGQVDDNSLRFGRAYMHLGAGEVEDAWRVAQSVTGPEQAEIAQSIAAKAVEMARPSSSSLASNRLAIADVGIAASALAVKLTAGAKAEREASALRTRAELLRAKAELVTDAAQRQALADEAKALAARADALNPAGRSYP